LFLFFFVLSSPYYFMRLWRRGDWQAGFYERFGHYDPSLKQALTNRHVLWIHAVSVGEVNLCTQLIRALEPRLPNLKIVVSCTTTTGMAEYRRRLPNRISKIYYPIDRRSAVNRAMSTINPVAIVLLEAEIWPNFIWRAQRRRVPMFLVNARLSDRSYPRYKRFGFLFRPLFATFVGVGCQNEEDAGRLRDVGCRPEVIQVVGNMKFDAAKLSDRSSLDVYGLLQQLGVSPEAPILVAGSTHPGEEALLADLAGRLRAKFPRLFLVLVPRHFERCHEVAQTLRQRGVKFIHRNEIFPTTQLQPGDVDCLLVNTTGELRFFYEPASVVFIGKSLTAIGGQNPVEPAALGKTIVFGPNMQNFADVVRLFLKKGAAIQVKTAGELETILGDLFGNQPRRAELGRHALEVVTENLGAINRTLEMILKELEPRGVYVAPPKK
jgi:3-deoxy-D-manno-octulosonic-acid transferase